MAQNERSPLRIVVAENEPEGARTEGSGGGEIKYRRATIVADDWHGEFGSYHEWATFGPQPPYRTATFFDAHGVVIWTTGGLPDKCAMQASKTVAHADDELRARLTSNTPRPAIGKHVLIAGVSIMNNQLFKQLVELQGCTSIITDDGEEGFQATVKCRPDLIIVDAMGSVGFKLARSLRGDERTRDIPLIVVSSHNEDAIIRGGHKFYDEFVAKPIRVLDFLKLLDKWLLPTQTPTSREGDAAA